MPHQNLEIKNGNRTPNRLRQHVWLDVSTFNKCLFTTKQGGFLLILICETSQIFVWRNKAFIFFQKSDIIRPTWFEDETAAKTTAEPMHGLRLIIKEDVPPLSNPPRFEALEEVAKRGLLAAETWHCNRPHVSLKTTVDVPLLGAVIEQNGDGCLEDSLMPVGWPLHLDGAVKQRCLHRTTTLSELNDLLRAYDMKRNLVELNVELRGCPMEAQGSLE